MWFLQALEGPSAAAQTNFSFIWFKLLPFIFPFQTFSFRLIIWSPTNIENNCNAETFTSCKKATHFAQQLDIAQLLAWQLLMWDRWEIFYPETVHICLTPSWRTSCSWWAGCFCDFSVLLPLSLRGSVDLCASSLWDSPSQTILFFSQ